MAVMIIVFFSSFFIMSAVINTQVVLQDVRKADAETMKQALAIGLHMDETEFHLMDEIFNATMSKLIEKNKKDLHIYTDPEIHFVQTDLLIKALDEAAKEHAEITDEASALEFLGYHPLLVEGRSDNIKITNKADLRMAKALVKLRERSNKFKAV